MSTEKHSSQQEAYNGYPGKLGKSKGENGSLNLAGVRMVGDHAVQIAFLKIEAFMPAKD